MGPGPPWGGSPHRVESVEGPERGRQRAALVVAVCGAHQQGALHAGFQGPAEKHGP